MSERIHFWDNYKGVLIFLVVFAHLLQGSDSEKLRFIVNVIYIFHMPAFVFISGYFGKSEHSRSEESLLKLLTAYILFDCLFSIIYNDYSIIRPFTIYWYLFALIIWRISALWLSNFKNCIFFLIIISILIGYAFELHNIFALSRVISYAPYYMAGYFVSSETAYNKMIQKSPRVVFTGIVMIILGTLLGYMYYNLFGLSIEELCMYPYTRMDLLSGIGRLYLILTASLLIYAIGAVIPNKKMPLLTTFGRYSLYIYLFHVIYLYINDLFLNGVVHIDDEYVYLIFAFGVAMAMCLTFSRTTIAKWINKLLSAGYKILSGNKEIDHYTIVVRILFCIIAVMFLFHNPILRIVDEYIFSTNDTGVEFNNGK